MLADCLHDLTALGTAGLPALLGGLFLAGLAGGLTHCAAMCGPFVLAQVAATADRTLSGGMLRRLTGAALLPYHAGRLAGYALLGALAGGISAAIGQLPGFRHLAVLLLLFAALLMFVQASARLGAWLPALPPLRLPAALDRRLPALMARPDGWRGFRLGLLLSALPCGLLYGALAAAAASGSALAGGFAMAAFVLGTMPSLIGLAALGRFLARGLAASRGWRRASAALFLLNGVVLMALALRMI
jgi:sulfite exporter TauE/SafE